MTGPSLVLASASPRRLAILGQLGLEARVRPADVDEAVRPGELPHAHVRRLARAKAEAVAATEPEALVIGGDTVVVLDGRVLGKPADERDAVSMLLLLAGRTHEVLSGVAVAAETGVFDTVGRTQVRFREFDARVAEAYVRTGEPLDKAGAYGIQERGAALVEEVRGDYSTVVGLPVPGLLTLFSRAGWSYQFGALHPVSPER